MPRDSGRCPFPEKAPGAGPLAAVLAGDPARAARIEIPPWV